MIGAGDLPSTSKPISHRRWPTHQPIKDTNIIGNGPDVLEKTDMVGNDFKLDEGGWVCGKDGQSVPVSLGMPMPWSAVTVGRVR